MAEPVPDPDSEVPKDVRDAFFAQMKAKQSERVRAAAQATTEPIFSRRIAAGTGAACFLT